MIKCQDCKGKILEDSKWSDWLKIAFYFEHELNEGEITNETYEDLINALVTFKPYEKE